MNQDKLKITLDGQEKIYDIYYSFTCPQTNKGYIAYTDHKKDSDGKEIVLVSAYDPNVSTIKLFEVTDQKELDMVNDVFYKIQKIA